MTLLARSGSAWDSAQGPKSINLHPGEVGCGRRGDRLSTLLGSCVAVVLTDPRRTVGVMCHIVHPGSAAGRGVRGVRHTSGTRSSHGTACAQEAFAHEAFAAMFAQLAAHGIVPRLCEAYVFGGANMFPDLYPRAHVGDSNARSALQMLAADGIRIVDSDLGGLAGRQVAWTIGDAPPEVRSSTLPVGRAAGLH